MTGSLTGPLDTASCAVFVDADNTLWDTNLVYADAQLALLAAVENVVGQQAPTSNRLKWLREIDQALAERHHAKLGYPPRLLAKALALALRGQDVANAARSAWYGGERQFQISEIEAIRIENHFREELEHVPTLRPGVYAGIAELRRCGCIIMVLTESSRERVFSLLRYHRLSDSVYRVIASTKHDGLFRRILDLMPQESSAVMIGDQLQSDIRPAKQAGLWTIYFPGGFRPDWEPAEALVRPDYRIEHFGEVPAIVARLRSRSAPPAGS